MAMMIAVKLVVFVLVIDYGCCQFPELLNFEYALGDAIANTATKHETCGTADVDGTCMTSFECYTRGGAGHWGNGCPFGKRCCVFSYGCTTRKVRERISYFTSTNTLATNGLCELTVEPINDNICQYRLDFKTFNLLPPQDSICQSESFHVEPGNNLPPLCGNNDGQHVYVHTNPRGNLKLNMHVDRGSTSTWKIKITQIECPGPNGFWSKHQLNYNVTSLIAPPGCTQYFLDRSGVVQSFAFGKHSRDMFIAQQHYAICFARTTFGETLRLEVLGNGVKWYDQEQDCAEASPKNPHLYFPAETLDRDGKIYTYACSIAKRMTLTTSTPGPFVIVVKSKDYIPPPKSVIGFRFQYWF